MKKVNIYIYTDITGRKKEGYYMYVLEFKRLNVPFTRENIQRVEGYTKNKAIMEATIEAMRRVEEPCDITVYTDTTYLTTGLQHDWISKWEENGWKNGKGKDIANKEEWQQLKELFKPHQYTFITYERHEYWSWMQTQVKEEYKKYDKNHQKTDEEQPEKEGEQK